MRPIFDASSLCTDICRTIFVILELLFHHERGLKQRQYLELFFSTRSIFSLCQKSALSEAPFNLLGTKTMILYLCICICIYVFVYLTVGNICFDVLGPWAFQKYSSIRFSKIFWAWWRTNNDNHMTLEQVCSLNIEQSRLLQLFCFAELKSVNLWNEICIPVY